jgi:pimeloyl-ACP methyl ester carboxylesterase
MGSSLYALRWFENAVTFQPDRYESGKSWVLPERAEDVRFLNRDRETLDGWFVHSSSGTALATVIFFHGQGGNITNVGWLGEKLASFGLDVLLVDYRGYGKSEGAIRNERDMYADADAAYDYVVSQRGTPPDRVILYGHSLGTAAVVDLASRRTCAAIILESGLSCATDIASVRLPWMPSWLRALGENKFDSARKLASVFCPVLVAHGEPDNVVPTEEGKALYAAANQPKRLIIIPGAGHGVAGFGGDKYIRDISEFIRDSMRGLTKAS